MAKPETAPAYFVALFERCPDGATKIIGRSTTAALIDLTLDDICEQARLDWLRLRGGPVQLVPDAEPEDPSEPELEEA